MEHLVLQKSELGSLVVDGDQNPEAKRVFALLEKKSSNALCLLLQCKDLLRVELISATHTVGSFGDDDQFHYMSSTWYMTWLIFAYISH